MQMLQNADFLLPPGGAVSLSQYWHEGAWTLVTGLVKLLLL